MLKVENDMRYVQEEEEVLGQESKRKFNGEGCREDCSSWNVGQEEKQDWPYGAG
jgi:hypothetical protein